MSCCAFPTPCRTIRTPCRGDCVGRWLATWLSGCRGVGSAAAVPGAFVVGKLAYPLRCQRAQLVERAARLARVDANRAVLACRCDVCAVGAECRIQGAARMAAQGDYQVAFGIPQSHCAITATRRHDELPGRAECCVGEGALMSP